MKWFIESLIKTAKGLTVWNLKDMLRRNDTINLQNPEKHLWGFDTGLRNMNRYRCTVEQLEMDLFD